MPRTRPATDTGEGTPSLCLLGGVEVRNTDAAVAHRVVAQSKVVALLAYLALATPGRHQRRDKLVGLLWPELDQGHARAALRKAILAVRTAFSDDALIGRGDEELLLQHEHLHCDAVDFESSTDDGKLARALKLYRGELMPGFHLPECAEFGMWLDERRTHLHERASGAAWAMACRLEESADLTDAGIMARNAVRFAWTDERVLRRAMTMLQRLGDRAGALRLYEDVSKRLRAELETEPAPETRQLAASIRKG